MGQFLEGEVGGAHRALAAVSASLDALIDIVDSGGLADLGAVGLVGFLQELEQLRNRSAVVDTLALRQAEECGVADELGQGRMSRVLTQALRISAAEAHRRLSAAEQLAGRTSMRGEPLPARRPVLAAAQRAGSVTPEQVNLILTGLAKVDRDGYDPADLDRGERVLTELAATFGPRDLKVCVDRFIDHVDPDGSRPQDQLNFDRRHVDLRPQRDGSWRGELHLTGVTGAKLAAVLGPLAKPRTTTTVGPGGGTVEEPDPRPHGQRMHDALEEVCDRLLRAGDLPPTGGVPATVVVLIDEESLRSRTGAGITSDGTRIPVEQVLQMAEQAEVVPTVLSRSGAVLTLGRNRRIASRAQTLALVARDRGCSFPGCSHPPEWCERHHIVPWIDGGHTDLDNLTLVCRYHHHNFAARGWSCRLNIDGLPEWVPPRHVDRRQAPLVNTRIQAALTRYTEAA